MRNVSVRFSTWMVGAVSLWLLAKVAAFGQEEKHYQRENVAQSRAADGRAVAEEQAQAFQSEPGLVRGWREMVGRQLRQLRQGDFEVLFVGDSLTQFWEAQGAPVWLLDFAPMKAANFGIAADRVENILWRLQNGLLPAEGAGSEVKLYVLMMGTNNLSASPPDSPEQVAAGVEAVVDLIEARRAPAKVILLSILPSGLLPDAAELRQRIARTNDLLEKFCQQRQAVHFTDVHDRFLDDGGHWLPGLTLDGTHLTRRGYDLLAAAIGPKMNRLLASDADLRPEPDPEPVR